MVEHVLLELSRRVRRELEAAKIAVGKEPTKANKERVKELNSTWVSVMSIIQKDR